MARHFDWRHLRGGAGDAEAQALGDKLLGYLSDIRRHSGVKSQAITRTLPDGTRVRARWVGDQPMVEVGPRPTDGGPTRTTLVQGFVARPRSIASATAFGSDPEALLDNNGPATPDADVSYINLLFDSTYNDGEAVAGFYGRNRSGQALFEDGLDNHGNVDWRNADESFVISWGGSTDRYFGLFGASNYAGKKACINGDVIVDLDSHPDLVAAHAIIGCCLQGTTLIVAVAREKSGANPAAIRIYSAPLAANTVLAWTNGAPLLARPRFAPVDVGDWELLLAHSFDGDDTVGVRDGHPLCFNQSGTEGRMLVRYKANGSTSYPDYTLREIVVDLADLEAVTLDLQTRVESLFVGRELAFTGVFARMAAIEVNIGTNPGPTEQQHWEGTDTASDVRLFITEATVADDYTPIDTWIPWAVDYKDDVAVYAWRRMFEMAISGTWAATPTSTFTAYSLGTLGVGTSTIDHSLTSSSTQQGIRLPWDIAPSTPLEITAGSETTWDCHTEGEATYDQNGDPTSTTAALSLGTTGTWDVVDDDTKLIIFHCDLRTDTIVYGLLNVVETIDQDMTVSRTGSDSSPVYNKDITGSQDIVTTLRTVVHVAGVDVADSGVVEIDTFTDTTFADESFATVNDPEFVTNGWLPVRNWPVSLDSIVSGNGTISAANADDTFCQNLIDGVPIPPSVSYAAGTYDLSGVATIDEHPDGTESASHTIQGEGASSPFENSLYGAFNLLSWGNISVVPYSGATSRRTVCYCCSDKDGNYCVSVAWPATGGGDGWLNQVNGLRALDSLSGGHAADMHFPIWLTTRFAYELSRG